MKIKGKNIKIVFPEAIDERIAEATSKLASEGILTPVLVGNESEIKGKFSFDFSGCEFVDPNNYPEFEEMVSSFVERRKGKVEEAQAREMLKNMYIMYTV